MVWGQVSYFLEMTGRYKLKRKKPKSVFPDRPPEEHPSWTWSLKYPHLRRKVLRSNLQVLVLFYQANFVLLYFHSTLSLRISYFGDRQEIHLLQVCHRHWRFSPILRSEAPVHAGVEKIEEQSHQTWHVKLFCGWHLSFLAEIHNFMNVPILFCKRIQPPKGELFPLRVSFLDT